MRFVADESVDGQIVDRLRVDGHDVLYIAEMDPGVSDDVVLTHANDRGALLITSDKDFGELVFRMRRNHAGVKLLHLAGLLPDTKSEITSRALRDHSEAMHSAFTVISSGMTRIRPAR